MCCPLHVIARHWWSVFFISTFLVWASFICGFGMFALGEDLQGNAMNCDKQYHLIKYTFLNVVFMCMVVSSYFLWKGGGEGARARALMILLFHFAFMIWGAALWNDMSNACTNAYSTAYWCVLLYQRLCVINNTMFFVLYSFHELYLGEKMQSDYTLFVELIGCGSKSSMDEFQYAMPTPAPMEHAPMSHYPTSHAPGVHPGVVMAPGMTPITPMMDPPPHSPPQLSGLP